MIDKNKIKKIIQNLPTAKQYDVYRFLRLRRLKIFLFSWQFPMTIILSLLYENIPSSMFGVLFTGSFIAGFISFMHAGINMNGDDSKYHYLKVKYYQYIEEKLQKQDRDYEKWLREQLEEDERFRRTYEAGTVLKDKGWER